MGLLYYLMVLYILVKDAQESLSSYENEQYENISLNKLSTL